MQAPDLLSSIEPKILGANEVHVWMISLRLDASELMALGHMLSDDERERATRYRFDRDRRRFIAARGRLRQVVGHYLGIPPGDVVFHSNPFGKPALAGGPAHFQFNLSHAEVWALIAVGRDRLLGIDVEPLDDKLRWEDLAPLVFTRREQEELSRYPPNERHDAFLRGWTRKEAYVKARGLGLSLPLDRFDVPLAAKKIGMLIDTARDTETQGQWRVYPIDLLPGHIAALVVEGQPVLLGCRRWPNFGDRGAAWAAGWNTCGGSEIPTGWSRPVSTGTVLCTS